MFCWKRPKQRGAVWLSIRNLKLRTVSLNGKIQIIDTTTMKVLLAFEGGNQPTGLDVSPDGKYLCFSNFQDENIELYEIK